MAEEALARARRLIEEKRYTEARALLTTVDHPTADKWLARLNQILAASTPHYPAPPIQSAPLSQYVGRRTYQPKQSFTTKLVVTLLLLLIGIVPGLIALSIFGREAKEALEDSDVRIPGANELVTLNRFVFVFIIIGLVLLALFLLLPLIGYYVR